MRVEAVFFDLDGVLLDSLQPHLDFCEAKAKQYGLDIKVPTAFQFKQMVANGFAVSPMRNFFLAIGFPPQDADWATDSYTKHFALQFPIPIFPGVHQALTDLRNQGLTLGYVTSNTSENVVRALGELTNEFEQGCKFALDTFQPALAKHESMNLGATRLGLKSEQCLYIGDQVTDQKAADKAGFRFMGVTYGWGFPVPGKPFDNVDDVSKIAARVESVNADESR